MASCGTPGIDIDDLVARQRVGVTSSQGPQVGRALGWYYVVDSEREGKEGEAVDV